MEKVIVVIGPTSVGKTKMGVALAKKFNGEVISGDSMQIYKQMDIGTAKPTKEEQIEAKHHLIDFVSPDKRYSVAEYKKDAEEAIEKILKEGIVKEGNVLKVDSFLNHQIDVSFLEKMGEEFKELFKFFNIWNRLSRN